MKYLVILRNGGTVQIVADDVDPSDQNAPYFNFWKSRGKDSSVTVAAIPIDQVVYITGEETTKK